MRFTITAATLLACAATTMAPLAAVVRQGKQLPLVSAEGLRLHNVSAEPATLHGRQGLRLTISADAARRFASMTAEQQAQMEELAIVDGLEFASGVIETEVAGAVAPGAAEGARGFVGIAFRLSNDLRTYDAFYLRPTNGRAEDQERRNHALQYVSHPDWPWLRLRKETPSRYESYADLLPGEWTKIRIEVRG